MVPNISAPETVNRQPDVNSLYLVTALIVLIIVTATFGALVFAFFWRSQNAFLWEHLRIPSLLWVTSAILIISSFTYEAARRRLPQGDTFGFFRRMQWTAGLGFLFLVGQGAAWLQILHSNVVLENDKHSWFIFLFSGLHAFHIIAGLGGLCFLLYRTYEPASGPKFQLTTRAAANALGLFWHYLTFIWLVLFVLLLLWHR